MNEYSTRLQSRDLRLTIRSLAQAYLNAALASLLMVVMLHLDATAAHAEYTWKMASLRWSISCGVDKGSIRKQDDGYVMKTSKNYCPGGIFKQRSEVNTKDISIRRPAVYSVQSDISFTSDSRQDFIFLQIHDGRMGCSPPLSVRWKANGELRFDSDYTKGKGMKGCVENAALRNATYLGPILLRDGTIYSFKTVFQFDGKGRFEVEVFVDGKSAIKGRYDPPKDPEFVPSTRFFFKHGVYSENVWKYEMRSRNLRILEAKASN